MSIVNELSGAMSAIITPFTDVGDVDVPSLERLVEAQIEGGIDGFVACGTTGETPTLSAAEQQRVVETVVQKTAGRVPVIAGSGSNNTKATVTATKEVQRWGADAALVVVPYYNKPSQDGIAAHYRAIQEETGVPVVAYNVPGRTVTDMMPDTIARCQSEGWIIGVKDATANMIRAAETLDRLNPSKPFAMLSGDDFTILPFVALGGKGVISVVSNILPGDTSRLVKLTAAKQLEEARPLNARIIALSKALFAAPNPVPLKEAMAMAGWCTRTVRLPLITDETMKDVVSQALKTYTGKTSFDGFMG
ncbi:MAG: 4-hydroxy-tetrahydrodipicolinate synthase [Myxococcota bacterium]